MSRLFRIAGIVLLAAIPVGLGFWTGWKSSSESSLVIESAYLDVGEIRTGRPYTHRVRVRNDGARTVHVPRVVVSCFCTQVVPNDFRLGPGEETVLSVTIDPTRLLRSLRDESGQFQLELGLFESGRRFPRRWLLSGAVERPVDIAPSFMAFYGPNVVVEGKPGPTLEARVTLGHSASRLSVAEVSDRFEASCRQASADGSLWIIDITPRGDLPRGQFGDTLWIRVDGADGTDMGEWPMVVKGLVVAPFVAIPSAVDLFPSDAGRLTERILIRSNLESPFRIRAGALPRGVRFSPSSDRSAVEQMVEFIFDTERMPAECHPEVIVEREDGTEFRVSVPVAIHPLTRSARQ